MTKYTPVVEALAEALYLAVTAPTDEQSQRAVNLAAQLWDQLPEIEVKRAQRMTEKRLADEGHPSQK